MHRCLSALGAVGLFAAFSVSADFEIGSPFFGTVSLADTSDSAPDPVTIMAGGRLRADRIDGDCVGFIQPGSPDVNLEYGDGTDSLFIYARAPTDTTLVVRAPDGSWHCNDDAMGFDPMVAFHGAQEGVYNIWVGTFVNSPSRAAIHVSEADPRTRLERMLSERAD